MSVNEDEETTTQDDLEAEEPVSEDPNNAETEEDVATTIALLQSERDSYLTDLQRIQADFDNFRRQAQKRQTDLTKQAASGIVEKILPVLDACEAAVQQGASDVEPIKTSLLETLQASGLEIVGVEGEEFNPDHHEAVSHEPSEETEISIVHEVMRSGYTWNGRTIRPAMVRVKG
tara:strand:- start:113 stop:637 length:525 start_codon:yes stop_codon:yes gene_type:complete